MNLNPLATAGLVMIGPSQVSQAWTAIQPVPHKTGFRRSSKTPYNVPLRHKPGVIVRDLLSLFATGAI